MLAYIQIHFNIYANLHPTLQTYQMHEAFFLHFSSEWYSKHLHMKQEQLATTVRWVCKKTAHTSVNFKGFSKTYYTYICIYIQNYICIQIFNELKVKKVAYHVQKSSCIKNPKELNNAWKCVTNFFTTSKNDLYNSLICQSTALGIKHMH